MKTIKKIKNNLGKVAGSALLVGATFATGGAMVTAQDSGSSGDLGDFPAPFVNDDGEVDTSVVVGETAQDGQPVSTLDVVSGVEIAGSLGNAAFMESEESVSVQGSSGWTATDGITLNREGSNLYAYDSANSQISVLEAGDLGALDDAEFDNQDDDTVQAEFEVAVGSALNQKFSSADGDLDDPTLYTLLPDANSGLFEFTAEFNDNQVQFSNPEMDNENVEMFGNTYTVDADASANEGAIVLYGASQTFVGQFGTSETFTVDDEEHTVETSFVNDAGTTATITVDGQTRSVDKGDTFTVSGQEVRVTDIFRTGPDGEGDVEFSIGSQEVILSDSNEVEIEGEEIDNTQVSLETDAAAWDPSSGNPYKSVEEVVITMGVDDDSNEVLEAGESYVDHVFGVAELHYGGLNTNAAENPAETVNVENSADDSTFSLTTDNGESLDITYASEVEEGDNTDMYLGSEAGVDANDDNTLDMTDFASNGDRDEARVLATHEGQELVQEDRFVLNYDERATMMEVSTVDYDTSSGNPDSTVEFEDVETGDTITLEEDDFVDSNGPGDHVAEFRHNREDYVAIVDDGASTGQDLDSVRVVRGTLDSNDPANINLGSNVAVYPNLYTESDHAVAFADTADIKQAFSDLGVSDPSGQTIRLPSTKSTSDQTVQISVTDGSVGGSDSGSVSFNSGTLDITLDSAQTSMTFTDTATIDGVEYHFSVDDDGSNGDLADTADSLEISPANQASGAVGPSAMLFEPEDDEDSENAFVFTPTQESTDYEDVEDLNVAYTGDEENFAADSSTSVWSNSDDDGNDMNLGYTAYGTYTQEDIDSDQESMELGLVNAQSTSGFAVTEEGGSLSASGSASGSVTSMMPTYEFADGVLDSDSNVGQVQNSDNLILVGGPSVNSLVAELADEGETWTADEYTEGEGLIQHVPNAFSEGQDAVIVAGYAGEDTRAAGEFLADYRNNEGALEGNQQVTISTESGQVVN